jgi:DNA-binding transcriptional LysR family regulator
MSIRMRFDLTDLRLLIAIGESGSLSRAAAEFPLALSAASNRLRQLEHRLGLSLFVRHADGMTATPAGRVALDHARRVVAEAGNLQQALDALAGRGRVNLRLAANTVASSIFLPPALGPFLADHPEVDLQVEERASSDILQVLRAGEIDLGILDGNLALDGIVSYPFRHDRLVLLAPAAHALAARPVCLFRDALGYPFVGMHARRAMQAFIEERAMREGQPLTVRVRVAGFTAMAQLVEQGVGLALLPEAAAQRLAASYRVRQVKLDDAWASRELRLCVRDPESLSAQARLLVAHLTDGAAQPLA